MCARDEKKKETRRLDELLLQARITAREKKRAAGRLARSLFFFLAVFLPFVSVALRIRETLEVLELRDIAEPLKVPGKHWK